MRVAKVVMVGELTLYLNSQQKAVEVLNEEYNARTLRITASIWWYLYSNEPSAFPDENSQKLKTPKDLMPLYLYLMSDDPVLM